MAKKKVRPQEYDKEIMTQLCLAISTSTLSLRKICRDRKFPSRKTLFRWLSENEGARALYARAKDLQTEAHFEDMFDIADQVRVGTVVKTLPNGKKEYRTADMIERARLQIDTRKWALSKLRPKKYGDRIEIDSDQDPLTELIQSMKEESQRVGPPPQDDEVVQ